jgi:hexosaminidase
LNKKAVRLNAILLPFYIFKKTTRMKQILVFLIVLFLLSACANEFKTHKNLKEDYALVPKPDGLEMAEGLFELKMGCKISASEGLQNESYYLIEMLGARTGLGFEEASKGSIQLLIDPSIQAKEGYSMEVTPSSILIRGQQAQGVFYGIQSLLQLVGEYPFEDSTVFGVPAVRIKDQPNYAYRGMHLDVCRHFFSVAFVKRYLDVMAMHKLNTFHWHLTEDQGWRIEIKKYPGLTEVGGYRNGTIVGHHPGEANDNEKYGGFYTQDEIRDIVAYAKERHIEVIPEIEMPGHSSAAIAAYPWLSSFPEENTIIGNNMMSKSSKSIQDAGITKVVQETWGVFDDVYCAGQETTFLFLEDVLTEVMDLFPSALIHIGGDECPKGNWERSPACQERIKNEGLKDEHELQSYFIKRIEKFVNSKGKNIIGWDEILEGGLAPNASVMSWRGTQGGIAAAEEEHTVVMSPTSHCYFDYYQSEDRDKEPLAIGGFLPVEKVYAFDPMPAALDAEKAKYILGGQANLWTEYIATESHAEYMLLPRMTALSEALWTNKANKDFEDFKVRLQDVREDYDRLGYNYAKHVFED